MPLNPAIRSGSGNISLMKAGAVSIVGRPNSGKSTLLNSIIGQKVSIVSRNPQTTRHNILGILSDHRGQIAFVDTPGIHKPGYEMNRRMLDSVIAALKQIDLILLVIDGSTSFGSGEQFALNMVKEAGRPAILLINKIDRIAKPRILPIIKHYSESFDFLEIIPISALKGDNCDLLLDKVFQNLPTGEALYDPEQVTDRSERFLSGELIREKILEQLREELPYTTAVLITGFDETNRLEKGLIKIRADILVEKRSQQGIIIGSGGHQLRDLGIAARKDLEQLLGCKVHLELTVRTCPRWRDDDRILNELGFGK